MLISPHFNALLHSFLGTVPFFAAQLIQSLHMYDSGSRDEGGGEEREPKKDQTSKLASFTLIAAHKQTSELHFDSSSQTK